MMTLFGRVTYDDDDLPSKDEAGRIFGWRVFQTGARAVAFLIAWLGFDKLVGMSNDVFGLGLLGCLLVYLYFQIKNLFWGFELDNKIKTQEKDDHDR